MKRSRVHFTERLTGLFGILVLIALLLPPWSDGSSALESPGSLDLLLLLIALAAILLPITVTLSARTDVPIVYETMLWTITLLFAVFLAVKLLFPPDAGFQSGYWLVLAGTVLMSFALWRSVGRGS